MINLDYLLIFILVICWTLTPFLRKKAIIKLTNEEYFVVNFLLTSLIALFVWCYLIKYGHTGYNVFAKMNYTDMVWAFSSALLSILSAVCLIVLIKNNNVTHLIPKLSPCVLLLTCLLGVIVFGETLSTQKILAIFLIILGLIVFHY